MAASTAPGRLEQVRAFLNTWRLPHDTRSPEDLLPALAADTGRWRGLLPDVTPAGGVDVPELTELRTGLREVLGQEIPSGLVSWLDRHPVLATVGGEQPVSYRAARTGGVPELLALVVDAVAAGQWVRLKACPDCKHVFYDNSRNRTRTWCGMYAGSPEGRACGSIAKVRAYRSRRS